VGSIAVVGFFVGSSQLTKNWANFSPKKFSTNLFTVGFIIRAVWVVFTYFFYTYMNGVPYEFDAADAYMYHEVAVEIANAGFSNFSYIVSDVGISDRGYFAYLATNYMIYGDNIFIAKIVKAAISAFTAILVYKLATRNFGEGVGKMAGIFCMLMPNMIYYCGVNYKEVEMIFLTVACIERGDYAIRSPKLTFGNLILPVLCGAALFTFRTVLAVSTLFAFVTAIFFTTKRTGSYSKRIILGIWVIISIAYLAGGKIMTEVEEVWNSRETTQETSLEWRAKRGGGNEFSTYASEAVFAPLIFIIPFTTEINISSQRNHQLAHGGYFVKNMMASFVMFALFLVVMDAVKKGKKWRDFLLVGSFLLGYMFVIASSQFAQSERFHMPAIPFFLIFAAYGVSMATNKSKQYYMIYLLFLFAALMGWQWFKLAGRGMA
jgi:4-amino-4-deoxy-L-arabinose transferase-like glycosyltransferase